MFQRSRDRGTVFLTMKKCKRSPIYRHTVFPIAITSSPLLGSA